jgi:isocitrate dehydrogenase (NAD+)
MLLSAAQMLEHIGLKQDAAKIQTSINKVLKDGKVRTRDLGGFATTNQFTAAVIHNI